MLGIKDKKVKLLKDKEGLRDFLHYNDFYIISSILILILLALIFFW